MSCVCLDYSAPLKSFADVQKWCEISAVLLQDLEIVATDDLRWRSVYQCRECGSLWAREYPFGEAHGGGPPCVYAISTTNPRQWLTDTEDLTASIRREHDDRKFFDSLGREDGPELCQSPNCRHKRIAHSVMCRGHHFEMVMRRRRSGQ